MQNPKVECGTHTHSEACGHPMVYHDSHVGFVHGDQIHCANHQEPLIHPSDGVCGSDSLSHAHQHHEHGEGCGHPRVKHLDHHDYLVGETLHHFHNDHCDHHGILKRFKKREKKEPLRRLLLGSQGNQAPKRKSTSDSCRFGSMILLTFGYFLVELIWGISTSSLALVADSMHMLSDLIAMVIGFYASKVSVRGRSDQATYGYPRMEVIGGLINAAFLLGICLTLLIDSLTRFTEDVPEDLKDGGDTLIIVACIGLGINLIALVVLGHDGHGHGHSHGGSGHGHSHGGGSKKPKSVPLKAIKSSGDGHGHSHGAGDGHGHSHGSDSASGHGHSHGSDSASGHGHSHGSSSSGTSSSSSSGGGSADGHGHSHGGSSGDGHGHSHGGSSGADGHGHSHGGSSGDGHGHSHGGSGDGHGHSHGSGADGHGHAHGDEGVSEVKFRSNDKEERNGSDVAHVILHMPETKSQSLATTQTAVEIVQEHDLDHHHDHDDHGDHGHSHGDTTGKKNQKRVMSLNLQGALLHVIGDAFGSIAVIITGLVIRFSSSEHRFLADPICTLFITLLIVCSTGPLMAKTVAILLQKAPHGLDVDKLQKEILDGIDGINEIHEFHVWQLTPEKLVGSMHIHIIEGYDFMIIADSIKKVLHYNGVHSSTIQPEFIPENKPVFLTETCHDLVCDDEDCHQKFCCPSDLSKSPSADA